MSEMLFYCNMNQWKKKEKHLRKLTCVDSVSLETPFKQDGALWEFIIRSSAEPYEIPVNVQDRSQESLWETLWKQSKKTCETGIVWQERVRLSRKQRESEKVI